ncbi:MAG: N-acetyltransferase family protein [Thermoplasmatota archaeon]
MEMRDATEGDLELLTEGLLNVRMIEKRPIKDIPVTGPDVDSFRKGIEERTIRVIDDEKGRGAAFVYYRTDMPIPYVHGSFLWIDIIYVREEHRGKGYGTALYEEMVDTAGKMGLDRIVIDIFNANERSKVFHSDLDFIPFYTIYIKDVISKK